MARKRTTKAGDLPLATWVWPPLEPGETEELRQQRIHKSLLPLVHALANQQARLDHEAGITRTETEIASVFRSDDYLHQSVTRARR